MGKTNSTSDWNICSWNVNGLRACVGKGFLPWLADAGCQVLGMQEVRAFTHQLHPDLQTSIHWHTHYTAGVRPGYSGVGMLSRCPPDEVGAGLGIKRFDVEGRMQWIRFGRLMIVNVYFP